MSFQLLNEKRYPLNVKNINDNKDLLPYYRFEHRVTLGYNAREFLVFIDQLENKLYIEEAIGGHLESLSDDELFESLYYFAKEKGYCNIMPPLLKESKERFV